MKKILNSKLFLILLTAIIVGSITAYATTQLVASNITYNDTTLDQALDNLYDEVTQPLNVNYVIGSHESSSTNHQTRIELSGYKDKYKYFRIKVAEPYSSNHTATLTISDDSDNRGVTLNLNQTYLTNEHRLIQVSSTAPANSYYKLNIEYFN